jgi:hypothetical protein
VIRRLATFLAARLGMELHYPPADDPPGGEPAGTRANDGTPCRPWPDTGERYEPRKAAARHPRGPRGEYR